MDKFLELIRNKRYDDAAVFVVENRFKRDFYRKAAEINNLIAQLIEIWDLSQPKNRLTLAILYYEVADFAKAIEFFKLAKEDIRLSPVTMYEFGESYLHTGALDQALVCFEESIRLSPSFTLPYREKAKIYEKLGLIDDALKAYRALIALNDAASLDIWGAAKYFESNELFDEALEAYTKAWSLSGNLSESFKNSLLEALESVREKATSPASKNLSKTINDILRLLKYDGDMIVHYTGISTLHALIFENSKFRLSEASFLNDPTEGTLFIKQYLQSIPSKMNIDKALEEKEYIAKPYIGSFVPVQKANNLSLWRMYGKADGVDAAGCSITLEKNEFINLTEKIINKSSISKESKTSKIAVPSIDFFNVAYIGSDGKIKVPNDPGVETRLDELCTKIKELLSDNEIQENIANEEVSRIAYLFKGAEYVEESEIRIVIFDKSIAPTISFSNEKTRVYWELENVGSAIRKVCFGPKTNNPEEVMSLYYHKFRSNGHTVRLSSSTHAFK